MRFSADVVECERDIRPAIPATRNMDARRPSFLDKMKNAERYFNLQDRPSISFAHQRTDDLTPAYTEIP